MELCIYVPRPGTAAENHVERGSAIVGSPSTIQDGRILCYFEGNRFGSENLKLYSQRLLHAAGRLMQQYPTVAKANYELTDLQEVGRYDGVRYVVTEISDTETLSQWCGETPEAVRGRLFEPGDTVTLEEAIEIVRDDGDLLTRLHDHHTLAYRTKAGQVILFNQIKKEGVVYDHDHPALPGLLDSSVPEEKLRRVLGEPAEDYSGPIR